VVKRLLALQSGCGMMERAEDVADATRRTRLANEQTYWLTAAGTILGLTTVILVLVEP
jgi:hypothetical protein